MTASARSGRGAKAAKPAAPRGGAKAAKSAIPETLEKLAVPVASLKPYGRNPRQGDVGAIVSSLERHGQYRPIVVNARTREVLAGNHTLRAAAQLGWEEIAATFVDVDDDTAARIVLVDNRSNDLAAYDDFALVELLRSLPDLDGTGFTGDDLDDLLTLLDPAPSTSGDTDPIEPPADPRTRPGDLYVLGEHRLLCGDSTVATDVERLMDGDLAQMVFTDPPYGVDYAGGRNPESNVPRERLANDHHGTSIYAEVLPIVLTAMDAEAPVYLWFAGTRGGEVYASVENAGLKVRALIVWHKLNAHYGAYMSQYMPKHEPLLYCVRQGARWHGPTNEVTVWEHEQPARNEHHPTEKPTALAERALTNSSAGRDIVLDLFAGSGSTLIAAQNLTRRAYLMELDPGYCDVIVDRWERHTGKTAERMNDGAAVEAVA